MNQLKPVCSVCFSKPPVKCKCVCQECLEDYDSDPDPEANAPFHNDYPGREPLND